jgi:Lantibiotic dehydratase, N terminus
VSSAYRIASPFLIRLAGAPFDVVEKLATPAASGAARELLAIERQVAHVRPAAWAFLREHECELSRSEINTWRKALRQNLAPPDQSPCEQLREFADAARLLHDARLRLAAELDHAVAESRRVLFETSARVLPPYLVFASEQASQLTNLLARNEVPPRNSDMRERERHLLLYLQRIASKNDTFSQFGPSVWGRIREDGPALDLDASAGVTRRESFPERWIAHALAASMNADPQVMDELRPRLNPNGLLVNDHFIPKDAGESIHIQAEQRGILERCDGKTPVRDIAANSGARDATPAIRDLLARKILIAAVEVPAMEPFACEVLRCDVEEWSEGAARKRWLPIVTAFCALASKFTQAIDPSRRVKILEAARQQLSAIGVESRQGHRALYAATNPIAEECTRECRFEMNRTLLDEIVNEAEPWIDFWRDSYAFIAARVATNLRALLEKAGAKNGAMPLPAFLRFCEGAKLSLTGAGLVGMAHLAFQEVKAAFRERLRPHADAAEYELTADDCAVVRNHFDYPKFDQFTYPSADLQLAAKSVEAVNRGEYRWIFAELHPAVAALHHGAFWSCPDIVVLSSALESMTHRKPACHFGFFAADFTAHTTVRIFDALPQQAVFVAPQRANPKWRYVAPAEVEVFIDEQGDAGLRRGDEYLGSFARNWVIPLGFHPFLFTIAPHTPRLRCGHVIVQRRAWGVSAEEFGAGNFSGVSRDLVVAVERLRAAKDWPRFIYIRPSEAALRRSGAENRDKDTKPVFIDLESYLFLEIFHRWLTKAGELEVTEMLPAPDELLWREADGRRTFELRTLICPR